MKYDNIQEGQFKSRPNRFIAYVDVNGKNEKVHVKNTGRCQELLTEGATVFLSRSDNPGRSTTYDLVAVRKGNRVINMDSQAPNKAVGEWLWRGGLFQDVVAVRPETKYHNSRFDFYVETPEDKIFIEVKGVTLEQDNVVLFPDAPSERAVKHVRELMQAAKEGYKAYVLFVVQMEKVSYFTPNAVTQPEFAQILLEARQAGVEILAYDCKVMPDSMEMQTPVSVLLSEIEVATRPLMDWYEKGRRILPWREEPTPYRVWVSEIMLQQTRVEAVRPYYDRFMKALPDVAHLASASEEELLKLWEGLGYYNRVRNMKKAAIIIMEEYDGRMPEEYHKLIKLPGIGNYTAGAICSIAYGKRVPAVDGNVLRVLSRLRGDSRDVSQQQVRIKVEEELALSMPRKNPGNFNQALMELGAVVCIPVGMPHCGQCPWESLCKAHSMGQEMEFPRKASKKPRKIEEKTILIIRDETRAAIRKRPERGLLAGLYEFPCLEGHLSGEQVISYLKEEGMSVIKIERLQESKHIFTHKEWYMIGYEVRVDELAEKKENEGMIFVEPSEVKDRYPIPSAYHAYLHNFLS